MKKILALSIVSIALCAGSLGATANSNRNSLVEKASPKAANKIHYVSTKGKNSNPGTISKPWRTIQYAAQKLKAGETVYIRQGIYKEHVIPKSSGRPGKYITYAAYRREKAVVDGKRITLINDLDGLINISARHHIRIQGLTAQNSGPYQDSNGILALNSENIVIKNNCTYNTKSSGIAAWRSKNVVIDGNKVSGACYGGQQECISVAGTDTFEVKNNVVRDAKRKEGICLKDGSKNGKVFKNVVYNIPKIGIYIDAWDKNVSNIQLYQNMVHDITNGHGYATASEMGGLLENIGFYNNIGYHNKFDGLCISRNGDSANHPARVVRVINNTFYGNGWYWGGGIAVDNPDAKDVVINNNICSRDCSFEISVSGDVSASYVTITNNLINDYKGDLEDGEVRGENYVQGDPMFKNVAEKDFHLKSGSPSIDKGTSSYAPMGDFDGKIRPRGSGYDIGAFEYGP